MKTVNRLLPLLIAGLVLGGCGKISEIHLTNYKVASVSPVGLRALDVAVDLGIDNPSLQFTVSDVVVELFRLDSSMGTFKMADPILVKPKTVANYSLKGRLALSDGVSLVQAMGYAARFKQEEYSLSYEARVTLKGGGHITLRKNKIPLAELFESDTEEGDGKKKK